jgi:N-methylhydantoinase A/oxoprolinase/acetone carboxylase beta subunit
MAASAAWQEPEGPARTKKPARKRRVFDIEAGDFAQWAELHRDSLEPLTWHAGPVVITEPQTTTVVPDGWLVQEDRNGHLLLEKSGTGTD